MVMSRRFLHNPTEKQLEALQALRDVVVGAGESGTGAATRVFAEAIHQERQLAWASSRGLKLSGGHACLARLLGKRCAIEYRETTDKIPCLPPGADHCSLWNKDGKPEVFVFQPYGMSYDTIRELTMFCEQWELRFYIDALPSWHFPGGVLTVQIRRQMDGW